MNSLTPPKDRPSFFRTISASSNVSTLSSHSLRRTFTNQKNKLRLYLALFPRAGSISSCDAYHWALLIGTKSPLRSEAGTAYHVVHSNRDTNSSFLYEETDLCDNTRQQRALMVRIAVGKIIDLERTLQILRNVVVAKEQPSSHYQHLSLLPDTQRERQDSGASLEISHMSCLKYVRSAWEELCLDPLRPIKTYFSANDWDEIETRARKYIVKKRAQGRFRSIPEGEIRSWNVDHIPSWNYWENRETTE